MMRKLSLCSAGALMLVSLLCIPLLSDDSHLIYGDGGTVYPFNNDNIRMVSENVKIRITDEKVYASENREDLFAPKYYVDCRFFFENESDSEQHIMMGFPEEDHSTGEQSFPDDSTMQGSPEYESLPGPELRAFRTFIDGKEIAVKEKIEKFKKDIRYPATHGNIHRVDSYFRIWHVWDVTFKPHQKIVVENSYWNCLSVRGYCSMTYVLETGRYWKGDIGEATIEMTFSPSSLASEVFDLSPGGYSATISGDNNRTITWKLKNVEPVPDDNIKVLLSPGDPNFPELNAMMLSGDFYKPHCIIEDVPGIFNLQSDPLERGVSATTTLNVFRKNNDGFILSSPFEYSIYEWSAIKIGEAAFKGKEYTWPRGTRDFDRTGIFSSPNYGTDVYNLKLKKYPHKSITKSPRNEFGVRAKSQCEEDGYFTTDDMSVLYFTADKNTSTIWSMYLKTRYIPQKDAIGPMETKPLVTVAGACGHLSPSADWTTVAFDCGRWED
jgi:hypothetical protein